MIALYDNADGSYLGSTTTEGVMGEYIELQLPGVISLAAFAFLSHSLSWLEVSRALRKFTLFGREVATGAPWKEILLRSGPEHAQIKWNELTVLKTFKDDPSVVKYDSFRLVISAVLSDVHCSIASFKLFAH